MPTRGQLATDSVEVLSHSHETLGVRTGGDAVGAPASGKNRGGSRLRRHAYGYAHEASVGERDV